jgi:hypothetical protein
MHTIEIGGMGRIHFNSDWSGDALITVGDRDIVLSGDFVRALALKVAARIADQEDTTEAFNWRILFDRWAREHEETRCSQREITPSRSRNT